MSQNTFMKIKISIITLLLIVFNTNFSIAQKKGYVEVVGSVLIDSKGLEGADIKVFKGNENSDNALTSANGKFILNLDYGFNYRIVFSKNGYVSKTVVYDSSIPEGEEDIIRSNKFKIELFKIPDGE